MQSKKRFLTLIFVLNLILVGCGTARFLPTETIYLPPTLAATLPIIQTTLPTTLPITPTPSCRNDLTFLQDLTLPDGSIVIPGDSLDKRWEVENTGTCNWEIGYTLRLITGSEMGAHPEHPLFPARAGSVATIRIIYTAPDASGIYRSAWQAYDSEGEVFGDPIFIEIVVP
jgi:hypothetical protein